MYTTTTAKPTTCPRSGKRAAIELAPRRAAKVTKTMTHKEVTTCAGHTRTSYNAEDAHHASDAYFHVDYLEHAQRDKDHDVDFYENTEMHYKGRTR
ncbi:hypothetical protein LTR32_001351 [Rachicladosporium monterosium]|uniref:Uncharacterized protein n=1 Tax=Rachicladosporium monterosium TaxID=1507873 RepID=A0ABR0LDF1_9PEZI|nr:hypothetical protein LTR32_001351 [Rachicladosporium monterosium]